MNVAGALTICRVDQSCWAQEFSKVSEALAGEGRELVFLGIDAHGVDAQRFFSSWCFGRAARCCSEIFTRRGITRENRRNFPSRPTICFPTIRTRTISGNPRNLQLVRG